MLRSNQLSYIAKILIIISFYLESILSGRFKEFKENAYIAGTKIAKYTLESTFGKIMNFIIIATDKLKAMRLIH